MEKRISSFIIACTLVFACVSMDFLHPVKADAAEWVPAAETMRDIWSLFGLFTKDSANYYGGFDGYSEEQKSSAIEGMNNFFGKIQYSELHNWAVVGKGIAEAKFNEWWENAKAGTLDFFSDVGSAVYDWLNAKSGAVAQQWDEGVPTPVNRDDFINGKYLDNSVLNNYLLSVGRGYALKSDYYNGGHFRDGNNEFICEIPINEKGYVCAYAIGSFTKHYYWVYQCRPNTKDKETGQFEFATWYTDYYNGDFDLSTALNGICVDDKEQEKVQLPPTVDDLEKDKQLPAVIDTYGGNLPVPQNNNDDDGKDDKKPVPYVPKPIDIDWSKIHPTTGGEPIIKIKLPDFDYNDYRKLQIQIKELTTTINNLLNLMQIDIDNNTVINNKDKTKQPIINPNFHMDIDLKKKFPFSLPWDVLSIFKLLNASPEAPAVTIDYPLINHGGGWGGYTVTSKPIEVDFDTKTWNKVAAVCRVMLFLLFAVGVCWAFFVK